VCLAAPHPVRSLRKSLRLFPDDSSTDPVGGRADPLPHAGLPARKRVRLSVLSILQGDEAMTRFRFAALSALFGVVLVSAPPVLSAQGAADVVEAELRSEYQRLRLVRVADGLRNPWAVAFLTEGRMLVSERPGRLLLVEGGRSTEVGGLPDDLHAQSQGGLLDVVPHPDFARNGWIYITYSRGNENATVSALMRARLDGTRLTDVEHLFQSNTPNSPGRHYGSRVLFLPDGTLLMTIGDRGTNPERAQDTRDHSGTIVRLNLDGSVPQDNPFVGNPNYAPEIYSYGHRNIQGIVQHPATGEIWATDHGPRGSDRLDRIQPGRNYGWPEFTLGRDYRTQEQFGDSRRHDDRFVRPIFEFLPTLAPSGLAVVQGDRYHSTWHNNVLAGGLRAQRILRLVIQDGEVVHAEELLHGAVGRIRDVRQGPDGYIYVLSDEEEGGLYRIEPAG
jgi:aldose sugar dehydrogenase